MYADDDGIFLEGVRRAAGNVADKFFLADGRGIGETFGNVNLLAADVRGDVLRRRSVSRRDNRP